MGGGYCRGSEAMGVEKKAVVVKEDVVGVFGLALVPLSNPDATLLGQLYGACVIFAWVFSTSFVVWYILKKTMGIRVSEEEEYNGMDASDCGIDAYPEFVSLKSAS